MAEWGEESMHTKSYCSQRGFVLENQTKQRGIYLKILLLCYNSITPIQYTLFSRVIGLLILWCSVCNVKEILKAILSSSYGLLKYWICHFCCQLHLQSDTDAVLNVTFIRAPSHALLKVDVPLVFIGDDVSPGLKKGNIWCIFFMVMKLLIVLFCVRAYLLAA